MSGVIAAIATAAMAGRTASQRATRYIPIHLPQTIAPVEIGATISTSRLPRFRSSPSAVGDWTVSSIRPSIDCKVIARWIMNPPVMLSIPWTNASWMPTAVVTTAPSQ